MATPIAEQALQLAKSAGIDHPTAEQLEAATRVLAKASLVVLLGPARTVLRGNASDACSSSVARDALRCTTPSGSKATACMPRSPAICL